MKEEELSTCSICRNCERRCQLGSGDEGKTVDSKQRRDLELENGMPSETVLPTPSDKTLHS